MDENNIEVIGYETEDRKPRKRRKRRRPLGTLLYMIFWGLILSMFSGLVVSQAGRYNELRAELYRLEESIAREIALTQELELQIMFFDSDAYIERRAREWLGMVRPNELVFRNNAE